MIILDTHTLVWMDEGNTRLGQKSRKLIDKGLRNEEVAVSSISFWEIAMLIQKKRLSLSKPVSQWMQDLLQQGLNEIAVTGGIGIIASELANFHGDPADRMIMATAIAHSATLITADKNILKWKGQIQRHDAGT